MRKASASLLGALLAVLSAPVVLADVTDMRENAFSIESTVTVQAPAAAAYRELAKVSAWWDPEHTWSGSAKNLSLDLKAGGCFCEKLAGGGSIQHGRILYVQPNVMLRMDAPLGPLQEMPVTGVLTFKLAPADGGTQVTMTYRVAGAFTLESAKLAPIVDQVMTHQLSRFKTHLDASVH